MTLYARIGANNVIEKVVDLDRLPDPNPTKGWRWLPVEKTDPPAYNDSLEIAGAELVVDRTKVTYAWAVTRLSLDEQKAAVKKAARNRILSRYPEWRQANMTARGVELLHLGEANWTAAEKQEGDALRAAWSWIKAVRMASDALERMSPIPVDFNDSRHWPES